MFDIWDDLQQLYQYYPSQHCNKSTSTIRVSTGPPQDCYLARSAHSRDHRPWWEAEYELSDYCAVGPRNQRSASGYRDHTL